MKYWRALILCGFSLCFVWLVEIAAAQRVHFRFNPPDDFPAYISTFKSTRTTDMGVFGKRTLTSEGSAKITTDKMPEGYSVTFAPISFTMMEDGEPVENPFLSFVQNITMTYELDIDGQLVEIRGFNGLVEKFHASLPDELASTFVKLLDEEALRNKTIQEWEARVGQFIGTDVDIGDMWVGVEETPLPAGGSMEFYSVTKFAERVKFDGVDCVRLEFSYTADAEELKPLMNTLSEEIGKIAETKNLNMGDIDIEGTGERIINPTTMVIYSETVERTIKSTMDAPGQPPVGVNVVDKREYGYEKLYP